MQKGVKIVVQNEENPFLNLIDKKPQLSTFKSWFKGVLNIKLMENIGIMSLEITHKKINVETLENHLSQSLEV